MATDSSVLSWRIPWICIVYGGLEQLDETEQLSLIHQFTWPPASKGQQYLQEYSTIGGNTIPTDSHLFLEIKSTVTFPSSPTNQRQSDNPPRPMLLLQYFASFSYMYMCVCCVYNFIQTSKDVHIDFQHIFFISFKKLINIKFYSLTAQ